MAESSPASKPGVTKCSGATVHRFLGQTQEALCPWTKHWAKQALPGCQQMHGLESDLYCIHPGAASGARDPGPWQASGSTSCSFGQVSLAREILPWVLLPAPVRTPTCLLEPGCSLHWDFMACMRCRALLTGRDPDALAACREHSSVFRPFHAYTLHQALMDGMVLDVLRNYKCLELVVLLKRAAAGAQGQPAPVPLPLADYGPSALRACSSAALVAVSRSPQVGMGGRGNCPLLSSVHMLWVCVPFVTRSFDGRPWSAMRVCYGWVYSPPQSTSHPNIVTSLRQAAPA